MLNGEDFMLNPIPSVIIGFPAGFHIFVSEINFDAFKFRQLRQTIISVSQILNRVIEILFETSGLIL